MAVYFGTAVDYIDARLRTLAAGATPIEVRDGETRGLILTVLPSGRKQFAVRYRRAGKQKRLLLGAVVRWSGFVKLSLGNARSMR